MSFVGGWPRVEVIKDLEKASPGALDDLLFDKVCFASECQT